MPDRTIQVDPDLSVTLSDTGSGRPVLLLHGGGGPLTVASIAGHLAGTARVLVPTHPGWDGTPRPERLTTIAGLADAYVRLVAAEDLSDVLVIGSSLGGWLAIQMVLDDRDGRISGLVLVDSAGVEVDREPMRDFFVLDARGVAEYSFHDSEKFYVDPATLAPEELTRRADNMATMWTMAGDPYMHDPGLLGQLGQIGVPTLVVWGDSDRIFTPGYGRAIAAAIPGAQWSLIADAGHLPHIEQPAVFFAQLDQFMAPAAT